MDSRDHQPRAAHQGSPVGIGASHQNAVERHQKSQETRNDRLILLVGTTASGKSELSLPLAEALGAEILCMDSMQVYQRMDVGTAKPTQEEQLRVPHHLLDLVPPTVNYSVADWLAEANRALSEVSSRGKRIVFCGGTGLYLKALLDGLFHAPAVDRRLRERLSQEGRTRGAEVLYGRLRKVDPVTASRVHPNDLKRIVRALEILVLAYFVYSFWSALVV